jgi:hypothetical protein
VETNNAGLPISGQFIAISATLNPPGVSSFSVAGGNLSFDCTGGVSGATYFVLSTTNLALPLSQWQPVATNSVNANGPFSIVVTNAFSPAIPASFYVLLAQ